MNSKFISTGWYRISLDAQVFGSLILAILLMWLMGAIAYLIITIYKESITMMQAKPTFSQW